MRIINKSRKIISINGEPLLPGSIMELPDGYESHPAILDYIAKGIVCDIDSNSVLVDDFERTKIAEEAIAKYKAEQEARTAREAEIKLVKDMKKTELLTKATGMGLEVKDADTADLLRAKIIAAINSEE